MPAPGREAWRQSLKQGTKSESKLQHKRASGSQPFSTPLFSEAKNHNDGMLSRSETEPGKKRKLSTAHLPDRAVTSPNNVSMAHLGNPGAEVDQFLTVYSVIIMGSDDGHSSGAFADTNSWLHLSTSPMERSKKRRIEPKKKGATLDNQLSLDGWKKAVLSWNNNVGH